MTAGDDSFVDKWLAAEPWHRLLAVFDNKPLHRSRQCLEALGHEFRQVALTASDPAVTVAKLGWWREEWRALAAGQPRHPLTQALVAAEHGDIDAAAGAQWVAAALALADVDADADTDSRHRRWQRFTQAQADASRAWLGEARAGDADLHALILLAERLPELADERDHGRLPLPLSALVSAGITRDRLYDDESTLAAMLSSYADELAARLAQVRATPVSPYRRAQAALAQRFLTQARAAPAAVWSGQRPPLGIRSAWSVWRAWRQG